MVMKWQVNNNKFSYQLNFSAYSSLYGNYTTNENSLIEPVYQFFQPRNRIKDTITIKDIENDYEILNPHSFTSYRLSNQLLTEETTLGNKSLLKSQLKDDIAQHLETDGYILTINTLIHDLLEETINELPVNFKRISIDSIIKLLEVDFSLIEDKDGHNRMLLKQKILLNNIISYIIKRVENKAILFFEYPELYLSPKEQLSMKEYLISISNDIYIFVVTNSIYMLSNKLSGFNYFISGKQIINDDLIDDLEWDSPLPYSREKLEGSLMNICINYIDKFELEPTISNYNQADIVIFDSMLLYVQVYLLKKLKFRFRLDIDPEFIAKPVYDYVMDVYEKI